MDLKALVLEEKALGKNRAASYKLSAFEEVDKSLFGRKKPNEKLLAIRDEAVEMYQSGEDAIILHYIAGRIKLSLRPHEFNMDLNNVLLGFYDARNWEVVRYIGEMIISLSENPVALRVLGDVAAEDKDEEKMWLYYERYVRSDHEDKEIIINVAKHAEDMGEVKKASKYYQRALLRLSLPEDYDKVRKVFTSLVSIGRVEFAFFDSYVSSIKDKYQDVALWCYKVLLEYNQKLKQELAKNGDNKSSELRKIYDNIISTLSSILALSSEEEGMRDALVSILKEKYSNSTRLNECLKKYNLKTSSNVIRMLEDFTKEIAYSKGSYFLQKATRKVGLIVDITNDKVLVRYSGNEAPQQMTLEAAFQTLQPLTNQNIKAIKKGVPAQKIRAKIEAEGGISWLARTLLDSTDSKRSTIKEMKAEMVPSIYTDEEWKKVSESLKTEFKNNEYVRITPGPTEVYELMPFASTPEDKMLYAFNRASLFYDKCAVLLDSYKMKEIDRDSDSIVEMCQYFNAIVEKGKASLDEILSSALVLELVTAEDDINVEIRTSFEDIYKDLSLEDKIEAYKAITGANLKKAFVDMIVKVDKFAASTLKYLIPYYPTYVPQKLKKLDKGKEYYDYLDKVLTGYKDNFAMFCFFFSCVTEEELKVIGMTRVELDKNALYALSTASKEMADNADNRKLIRTLKKELLDSRAASLIRNASDEDRFEIKAIILSNKGFDSDEIEALRKLLYSRWPDLKEEKKVEMPAQQVVRTVSGFLCLSSSYDRKQAELRELNTVDIPQILKEINTARELGDLRENAEYQYAKEHKRELDRRIGALNNELNTVRIVRREDVLPGMVGFGTKVCFLDNLTGKQVVYTFLGRWESNPEEGIIDFNAPLGQHLVNHKEGERVQFEINGRKYDYSIKTIEIIVE